MGESERVCHNGNAHTHIILTTIWRSYASFETNQPLGSYGSLINNVVRTFRPRRFVLTLMADEGGVQVRERERSGGRAKRASQVITSVVAKLTHSIHFAPSSLGAGAADAGQPARSGSLEEKERDCY